MSISKKELGELKLLLLKKQDALRLIKETGEGAADIVELDQTRVGRLTRMDAMQAQAMSVETNRRREIEIQRIASALQRMESGEYGYCIKCEEEISGQRLAIEPSTLLCIDCARM